MTRMESGFPSSNPTKNTADRHANSSEISFAEHVSRHDFTAANMLDDVSVDHKETRRHIDLDAEIRERNARPQWITVERRGREGRAQCVFGGSFFSSTIILNSGIKCSRTASRVERRHCRP